MPITLDSLSITEPAQQEYVDNGPEYPQYLSTWSMETYPPLEPRHVSDSEEPGLRANPAFPNLFPKGGDFKLSKLTPKIGSDVDGVQISALSPEGLDELALYVAQRGVVAFRNQDLKDAGLEKLMQVTNHFGPAHVHPTTAHPAISPHLHVVYRDQQLGRKFLEEVPDRNSSISWHSDVTYEVNPPSTTFLLGLAIPPTGGDTLYSSSTEAYKRLSPSFRERLHGLRAIHSSFEQDAESRSRCGPSRRPPIQTEQPIIRRHPVTKEPMLFVNEGFTRKIVGWKKEESDYMLKFLFDHIARGQDFQCRVRWAEGTIIVWDNRSVVHSAVFDYDEAHRRHAIRLTPQGEIPILV
ncbi:taurine dioxygenase [Leucosporidium creatinivorum]|uniref:Taurine dioxygenase n=1 Tax=Leucosporidium creatinivorum TaxID=106004 RepID=A0A1Y2G584_9BASI|nr:taurine dioxygenase [Leucosporidium creatinivorum]